MPTVDDLARLKSLLEKLTAIAGAQRGELILAEDWNTLVESVSSLARVLLGQDPGGKVPAHEHLDQVTVDWLVPVLRDQLQRGPLSDPAMQKRLLTIEQQLRSIAAQIDGQRGDVEGFRGRLTDIVTRDIVRETTVTDVGRKIAALGDARTEVLDLRRSIGSVQSDLGKVIEAASRLEVNGQPVDVGALSTRLGALETFRKDFTGANGQELTGTIIEQRLAENRNQFVTQKQLDDVLKDRTGTISDDVLRGLEDRVGANIRIQTKDSFDSLSSQIRTDMQARLEGVGTLIDARLKDSLPGVATSLTATLGPAIDKAREDAIAGAVDKALGGLAASEKALRAELTQLNQDLQISFAANVKQQLALALPAELSGLRADLAALNTKSDVLSGRTNLVEASLATQGKSVSTLEQDAAAQSLKLRDLLKSELKLAIDAQTRDITSKFSAIQTDLKSQLEAISRDVKKTAIDDARSAAIETAQAEARNARTQVIAEMRLVAREEAGVLVRDQLRLNQTNIGGTVVSPRISPIVVDR